MAFNVLYCQLIVNKSNSKKSMKGYLLTGKIINKNIYIEFILI